MREDRGLTRNLEEPSVEGTELFQVVREGLKGEAPGF